jgi:hypothetical protein
MSGQKRESTLFLSPLDAFAFDFAPTTVVPAHEVERKEDANDDLHSDHGDAPQEASSLSTPAPTRAPLTLEEVNVLCEGAMTVGERYFSLPQNAPTFEQATAQYVQVLQRQSQVLKQEFKERQKRRESKKKRDRAADDE